MGWRWGQRSEWKRASFELWVLGLDSFRRQEEGGYGGERFWETSNEGACMLLLLLCVVWA